MKLYGSCFLKRNDENIYSKVAHFSAKECSTLLQDQIYSKAEVSARQKGKYDTLQSNSFQLRPHSE